MQQVELNVVTRNPGIKTELRQLRLKGLVPANIYGPGKTTQACAMVEKDFRKAYNNDLNSNFILNLKSETKELNGRKVILKSVERDPTHWTLLHADLYEISVDRPLTVSVPIHFNGSPEGVRLGGGILQVIRRSIKIKALPGDIPQHIDLDITNLQLNQNIHLAEVKVPEKIKIMDSGEFVIVTVVEPEKEEVVAVAAVEGAAAPTAEGAAAAPAAGDKAAAGADAKPAAGAKPADAKPAAPKGGKS